VRRFSRLYARLDATNSTRAKVALLAEYFREAPRADAAWALWFLAGNRPNRLVPARTLAEMACAEAGVPAWLFEECYHAVGDLAETIAHLLPGEGADSGRALASWVEEHLLALKALSDAEKRSRLSAYWSELDAQGRFLWNKLITGEFRVGVSRSLVVRALAEVSGLDPKLIAERLAGAWQPSAANLEKLLSADSGERRGEPYPFFLAHALQAEPASLGALDDWLAEWKWDGIRAQLVRRAGRTWLWSRGEDLVTERFPEVVQAAAALPEGSVLDGEVLAWQDGAPLPFARLQQRIGRRALSPKILAECPAAFLAFDLLEENGVDIRGLPLAERRRRLEALPILTSRTVAAQSWEALAALRGEARSRGVEGLMLKRRASGYGVGRTRGDWWKWKLDPMSVDAVLVYAQRGHGRRASLFTDYTFAVWAEGALVPFAKAYSGLTDAELRAMDAFIRRNTSEKFGPVRTVKPQIVCEIGFEGIQRSRRHKSGVAVRFPRILKIRADKTPAQADSVAALQALLPG
jgi:DNA ligase 1